MIFKLLLIQVICVIVIDMTDFIDSIKSFLSWVFTLGKSTRNNYRLKPIDCSLCSTLWTCIAYLWYTGNLSISTLALSLCIALFSDVTGYIIRLVKDYIIFIIQWLQKPIYK